MNPTYCHKNTFPQHFGLLANLCECFYTYHHCPHRDGHQTFSYYSDLSSKHQPQMSPIPKASLIAQGVKNLPAMQETWVHSPSREDSLEEEMATYSSILAWRIPWTEEPSGL